MPAPAAAPLSRLEALIEALLPYGNPVTSVVLSTPVERRKFSVADGGREDLAGHPDGAIGAPGREAYDLAALALVARGAVATPVSMSLTVRVLNPVRSASASCERRASERNCRTRSASVTVVASRIDVFFHRGGRGPAWGAGPWRLSRSRTA